MAQTPYPTCRQISASGKLCGSPALRGKIFCYNHSRDRQRRENLRRGLAVKFQNGQEDFDAEILSSLDLPAPDDPIAAQVCLSNTFLALASGVLPTKRAAVMLYNLQIITAHFATVAKYKEKFEAQQDEPVFANDPVEAAIGGSARPLDCGTEAPPLGVTRAGRRRAQAVSDPEPVASIDNAHRQADFMFSEERYEKSLETDEPEEQHSAALASAVLAQQQSDERMANPDLPLKDVAPLEEAQIDVAMGSMSDEGWEKFCDQLWITHEQREALKQKVVWSTDRAQRDATRRLLLKYNPRAVLGRLEKLEKMKPLSAALDDFQKLPDDTKATG